MDKQVQDTQNCVTKNPTPITQEPHRSSRISQKPERYGFLISDECDVLLIDQDESMAYKEGITGPESQNGLKP